MTKTEVQLSNLCQACANYKQGQSVAGGRCPFRPGQSLHPEDHCSAKRVKPGTEGWEQPQVESCFEAKAEPKPVKVKAKEDIDMLGPDPEDELVQD